MPRTPEINRPAPVKAQRTVNGLQACGAVTIRGGACGAPATMPDGRCPHHTTTVSEKQKKAWRTRGQVAGMRARMPVTFEPADFSTEEGARRALESAADAVRAGKLPTSVANAVAKLAAVGLRLGELRLAQKLAEIEAQLKSQGRS